jgi:hypothetical protein
VREIQKSASQRPEKTMHIFIVGSNRPGNKTPADLNEPEAI